MFIASNLALAVAFPQIREEPIFGTNKRPKQADGAGNNPSVFIGGKLFSSL
ncbi:MAG: hypothetical protein Q8O00_04760 [Holophaga sp.]|nr:hypothetical protein [Holophaga sp.]